MDSADHAPILSTLNEHTDIPLDPECHHHTLRPPTYTHTEACAWLAPSFLAFSPQW